ncbi:ABC transporter permease [Candidatus Profftia sp. (ex Adelges kitamiensis)]|uniref:ABC transporter permease n=1 Tax=Candidatus Profftia sp. (ex Adelges kitamiensis) TaxID=2864218 RepID=UPI001CE392DE|nr:ABC transporter permease [Candidatus Profftia sp. (ex Adelges kitamiensis)]
MNILLHWIAFKSICNKEIHRLARIWIQTLIPPIITITLYFIIFGNLIGPRIGVIQNYSYIEYIIPGLVMMSVITNAYSNVASSVFSAKFQRNIEELLVAPIPTYIIITGLISGGVIRGIFVGTIVMLISLLFIPLHIHNWIVILAILLSTAILFSLIGLLNAIFAKNFDDISLIPTFILTPLIYLGGVFYPLTFLTAFWQTVSKLNPIFYMISGLRFGFLGINDTLLVFTFVILIALILLFYLTAAYFINYGNSIRN